VSGDRLDDSNQPQTQSQVLTRSLSLVIAGGGTGGHLFPAIAVAEHILGSHEDSQVHFIGTGNPFETRVLNRLGYNHERIQVKPLKGKSKFFQAMALATIPASIVAAIKILRRLRPDAVLGVGGYSAGPVVVAAWILGIPRALHEQNLIPGMTNRFLASLANRIYVSFENTQIRAETQKIRLTGNPVRKNILQAKPSADASMDSTLQSQNRFTVLIIGGSQGAHRINMTVIAALPHLESRHNLAFIHQTGTDDEPEVSQAYQTHNMVATVQPFFDDMQTCYHQADLVICRAGASTVAELGLLGKRVIFIPYPFAADDHQAINAGQLVSAGAAEMILEKDLTPVGLANAIEAHRQSPEKGRMMAANLKRQARPHAARDIVADLYELVSSKE
jgi:UDP-N-acetylglucosamine--N-acetylmuramyl-(pentapeptide) pyrophosphoryl-undecaprenol N-acetylglucosamine transferase